MKYSYPDSFNTRLTDGGCWYDNTTRTTYIGDKVDKKESMKDHKPDNCNDCPRKSDCSPYIFSNGDVAQ